jgi:hypothetical protein
VTEIMNCALCDKDLSEDDLETHIGDLHDGRRSCYPYILALQKKLEELEQTIEMSHGPVD